MPEMDKIQANLKRFISLNFEVHTYKEIWIFFMLASIFVMACI